MNSKILNMKSITKTFPGVVALKNVSFDLEKGEIHALVGENGAGKSTLMKVLGGVHIPDNGSIEINDKVVRIKSPVDSISNSISIIYQEFNLIPTLSVSENIFLGKEVVKNRYLRSMNRKIMNEEAKKIMELLGIGNLDCRKTVADLSVAQQQLVEIGKALFNNSNILVMDEPTAMLTEKESNMLFCIMNDLRDKGISIIYISHRLEEVVQMSDRITVLRDGQTVTTLDNSNRNIQESEIVKCMVGRSLDDYFPEKNHKQVDETVFEVKNLTKKDMYHDISFKVRKGEVLGFAGLVGAGRTEVMKSLFGGMSYDSGEILLNGKKIHIKQPQDAIKKGIAFVPEDRKNEGVVLKLDLCDNIALPNYDKIKSLIRVSKNKKNKIVDQHIRDLNIRPALPKRKIADFSGGNQQKAVVAKWLARNPNIIILDEPTRGIDVGAKREIYNIINDLSKRGVPTIMVSSEMMELIGMCDRIIVLHNGEISGEFSKNEFTQERIMAAAAGIN